MDQRANEVSQHRVLFDFDATIGANLRRFRNQRGLTGAALGTLIGTTNQQVSKYENGEDRIAASRLLACSLAMGIPVECFFEGIDGIGADLAPRKHDRLQRAAGELMALPEPFRTSIINVIQATRRVVDDIAAGLLRSV